MDVLQRSPIVVVYQLIVVGQQSWTLCCFEVRVVDGLGAMQTTVKQENLDTQGERGSGVERVTNLLGCPSIVRILKDLSQESNGERVAVQNTPNSCSGSYVFPKAFCHVGRWEEQRLPKAAL